MQEGLLPLKEDLRDFPLGAIFGVEKDLPREFLITGANTLKVKDQGDTDLCSAYSVCYASELQEEVELNPQYQFAFSKLISGNIEGWGQDLRSACKTPVVFGGLEETNFSNCQDRPINPRDYKEWGEWYINEAKEHKKQSYFRADLGFTNKFDLLKSAMFKHNSAIVSGLVWKRGYSDNAVIKPNNSDGFGHAITLVGWTVIKGIDHLIIHNSIGNLVEGGRWYLPRDMVDELKFGNYIFVDLPRETVEDYLKNDIMITDSWFVKLYKIIKNFLWT